MPRAAPLPHWRRDHPRHSAHPPTSTPPLTPAQVAADLLARAWPVVQLGFSRTGAHEAGCERLARALRHGIKAAGKACGPLLQHLLEAVPVLFQQTRRACFMYVVSELVKVGGAGGFGGGFRGAGSRAPPGRRSRLRRRLSPRLAAPPAARALPRPSPSALTLGPHPRPSPPAHRPPPQIFGDEPQYDGALGPIVKGLLTEACSCLPGLAQFNEQPEFADDTFLLGTRALHYCPRLVGWGSPGAPGRAPAFASHVGCCRRGGLVDCWPAGAWSAQRPAGLTRRPAPCAPQVVAQPLLGQLWDSALAGLLVQHREACCGVLGFLCRCGACPAAPAGPAPAPATPAAAAPAPDPPPSPPAPAAAAAAGCASPSCCSSCSPPPRRSCRSRSSSARPPCCACCWRARRARCPARAYKSSPTPCPACCAARGGRACSCWWAARAPGPAPAPRSRPPLPPPAPARRSRPALPATAGAASRAA
jgi:hypothetical protein